MNAYEKLAEQLAEAEAAGDEEKAERLRAAMEQLGGASTQSGGTGNGPPGEP